MPLTPYIYDAPTATVRAAPPFVPVLAPRMLIAVPGYFGERESAFRPMESQWPTALVGGHLSGRTMLREPADVGTSGHTCVAMATVA